MPRRRGNRGARNRGAPKPGGPGPKMNPHGIDDDGPLVPDNKAESDDPAKSGKAAGGEFKFPSLVESTIKGIVDIIGECATTIWLLIRHPIAFADLVENTPGLVKPLTFVALIAFISGNYLYPVTRNPTALTHIFLTSLRASFQKLTAETLLTKALPIVLFVMLVGFILGLFGRDSQSKNQIRSVTCYGAGAAFLELLLVAIVMKAWMFSLWERWIRNREPKSFLIDGTEEMVVFYVYGTLLLIVGGHLFAILWGAMRKSDYARGLRGTCALTATVALLLTGTILEFGSRFTNRIEWIEKAVKGDDAYKEAAVHVISVDVDRVNHCGRITLGFKSPSPGISLKLLRPPMELTLSRFEGGKGTGLLLKGRDVEIEKWSAGESPFIVVKPDESGWLTVSFSAKDATAFDKVFVINTRGDTSEFEMNLKLRQPTMENSIDGSKFEGWQTLSAKFALDGLLQLVNKDD